jgi:serine phosphatase RsbU (regulator of sigma subunit)
VSPSARQSRLWLAGSALKRAIRFATYDWTRELPLSLRVITMIGMGFQGYAIWAALSGSLIWPIMWPSGVFLYATITLIYYVGFCIQNATLASELIRKTQLESEQLAAQTIQKTLQPTTIADIPGYEVNAFYKPLRAVGGDYFDVVDLPGNRTLFVVADVSGKGMAAALLAANIQALVRSLSTIAPDVPALASQINRHLFRYTPGNRFSTAPFTVLDRDSGELVYVNAGHNPPIVWHSGRTNFLEATGTALGWFDDTTYHAGRMTIPREGGLLIYTDGLPDSIPGNSPEDHLHRALESDLARTMSNLKALVDPRFNEDDVTVLLVKRTAGSGVRLTADPA